MSSKAEADDPSKVAQKNKESSSVYSQERSFPLFFANYFLISSSFREYAESSPDEYNTFLCFL